MKNVNPISKMACVLALLIAIGGCGQDKEQVGQERSETESTGQESQVELVTQQPTDDAQETEEQREKRVIAAQQARDMYDRAQIGSDYNQVKNEISEQKPTEKKLPDGNREVTVINEESGDGVELTLDGGGSIISKSIIITDTTAYQNEQKVYTRDMANSLESGMSYEEVSEGLGGEGVECSEGQLMDGVPLKLKSYKWFDKDGAYIVVSFDSEGKLVVANFVQK